MRPAIALIAGLTTGCAVDNPFFMVGQGSPGTTGAVDTTGEATASEVTGTSGTSGTSGAAATASETGSEPTTAGGETTGSPGTTIDVGATDTSATTETGGTSGAAETDGGDESTGGPVCGDLVVDDGEACDDGNKVPGDGCESNCRDLFRSVPGSLVKLPQDLAVADMDGDGVKDLIIGNGSQQVGDPDLSVGLGDGDGTFDWKHFATVSLPGVSWVLVGQFVADEKPDIILVPGNGMSTLAVWENASQPGNLELVARMAVTGPNAASYIGARTGDLNGDGFADLMFVDKVQSKLYRRLNTGKDGFATNYSYMTGAMPIDLAFGTVTGDELPDVVVAYDTTPALSVFTGDGMGTLTLGEPLQGCPGGADSIAIGDADKSEPQDLVVTCSGGDTALLVGHDGDKAYSRTVGAGLPKIKAAGIIDLYGDDDDADVFAVPSDAMQIVIAAQVGQQFPAQPLLYPLDHAAGRAVAADFDDDGAPDLAVLHPAAAKLTVLINQSRMDPPVP